MNITQMFEKQIRPHIHGDTKRAFIESMIMQCNTLTDAARSLGISRQRGHTIYLEFLDRVVPHIDIEWVRSKVTDDLLEASEPWVKLLMMAEHKDSEYTQTDVFFVKKSVVPLLKNLTAHTRKTSASQSVTDITDMYALYAKSVQCKKSVFLSYIEHHLVHTCPTSLIFHEGHEYLIKVMPHDIRRLMKMIYVSPNRELPIDKLYQGYARHMGWITSAHIMQEHEHHILCSVLPKHEAFSDFDLGFSCKNDMVSLNHQEDSPLSSTEEIVHGFFMDLYAKGQRRSAEIAEIKAYMEAHDQQIPSPTIRKMMASSCIIEREDWRKYRLFGW